jgi:tetratricopeptide (TPR) repeat protein
MIEPRTDTWSRRAKSGGFIEAVFGEGRRLFANHFFVQADVYFHSGFYPSIFDQQAKPKDREHLSGGEEHEAVHQHDANCKHEAGEVDPESAHYKEMDKGKPRDWVEAFGRHFTVTTHKHLSGGNEREMLPWLRLSAELDPQHVETYTVAAYWLGNIGKTQEAEDFLRLGLRNNPDSYEILFELAQLLERVKKDDFRARNLLLLAMSKWERQEAGKKEPDKMGLEKILVHLAKIEERAGNYDLATKYFQQAKVLSPKPEAVQEQIDKLRGK